MTKKKTMTQKELMLEYFIKNRNRDIPHDEVVDWATKRWEKLTGKKFRDPDRAIRSNYQQGLLIKVSKGVYRYDPDMVENKVQEDFTTEMKRAILEKYEYKCVICGQGIEHGLELHVDHIKPKERGGKAEFENGQVLCSVHNFRKGTYSQTETAKRFFVRNLEKARLVDDKIMIELCERVLAIFEELGVNDHITWKK